LHYFLRPAFENTFDRLCAFQIKLFPYSGWRSLRVLLHYVNPGGEMWEQDVSIGIETSSIRRGPSLILLSSSPKTSVISFQNWFTQFSIRRCGLASNGSDPREYSHMKLQCAELSISTSFPKCQFVADDVFWAADRQIETDQIPWHTER
jgi:hypothetical protein